MRPRAWHELYELLFATAFAAMMLYTLANSAVPDILLEVERRGHSAGWVSIALLCLIFGSWSGGWYFVGPVSVSSGALQWQVWRRHPAQWLRRETRRALLIGGFLAAVIAGSAGLALSAVGSAYVIAIVTIWVVLVGLVVLMIQLQRRDLDGPAGLVPFLFCWCGVILSVGVAWDGVAAGAVGGVLLGGGLVAGRPKGSSAWVGVRSQLTPRWQLQRGARNRWSLTAGVVLLDAELVRTIRQRDAKVTKRLLPGNVYRLPHPVGLSLVVLLRGLGSVWVMLGLSLLLAFTVRELLGPLPAVCMVLVSEFCITVAMSRAAKMWAESPALARIWSADRPGMSIALAAPGLLVCTAIAVIVTLGMSLPLSVTLVLVVLPGAVIVRRRSVRRDGSGASLISTPMGPVPLETANRIVAGPDMLLVGLLLVAWLM